MKLIYVFFITFIILGSSCNQKKGSTKATPIDKNTLIEVNKLLVEKDKDQIKSYIGQKNWEMNEAPLGFWYFILKDESGTNIINGDHVTLQYTENLPDGTICKSATGLNPVTIRVGYSEITRGLDEGLYFLSEGDSARIILPPFFAYGLPGNGSSIPPRSVIIYQVKVLDVKHP